MYDNISSHIFGLVIGFIGSKGVYDVNTYTDVEIITDRSANRIAPYQFGMRLPDSLEFEMEVFNKHGQFYENYQAEAIQEWLFGRAEPKYLSILDPDKGNESYLCRLVSPRKVKLDNKIYGWRFTVVCTSAYSVTDIVEKIYDCSLNVNSEIIYYNLSTIEEYVYPEMDIRMAGNSTYVLLENLNDNNRIFQITNIAQGDVLHVNNDNQFMTSDKGGNVFQNFNLNWFRFAPGYNKIYVSGRCIITFRNRFLKSIGGF